MAPDPHPSNSADVLTRLEQEQERQHTLAAMKWLRVDQLRLVRAWYADVLESDACQRAKHVARVRGEVVHSEIQRRESMDPSIRAQLVRALGSPGNGLQAVQAWEWLKELPADKQAKRSTTASTNPRAAAILKQRAERDRLGDAHASGPWLRRLQPA